MGPRAFGLSNKKFASVKYNLELYQTIQLQGLKVCCEIWLYQAQGTKLHRVD